MKSTWKKKLHYAMLRVIFCMTVLPIIYFLAAALAWQVRNPKANQMTVLTYFTDVVQFRKLDKFQE